MKVNFEEFVSIAECGKLLLEGVEYLGMHLGLFGWFCLTHEPYEVLCVIALIVMGFLVSVLVLHRDRKHVKAEQAKHNFAPHWWGPDYHKEVVNVENLS